MALLGIGGILLIGVTVGVTLWATGNLPNLKTLLPMNSGGSQDAARAHLASAMEKWMSGEKTEGMVGLKTAIAAPPIGYEIKSILPIKPTIMNVNNSKLWDRKDFKEYPAFLINVIVEFKSEAGTPLKHAMTYTLVWDRQEKEWWMACDFSD